VPASRIDVAISCISRRQHGGSSPGCQLRQRTGTRENDVGTEVRRLTAGGNRIRTIGPAEKETAAERPRGRPSSPRETTWA
jgi:hypothetical protein